MIDPQKLVGFNLCGLELKLGTLVESGSSQRPPPAGRTSKYKREKDKHELRRISSGTRELPKG